MNTYLTRNTAQTFFSKLGNINSVRLGQNKNDEIGWIHSINRVFHISKDIGKYEEIDKTQQISYRKIDPDSAFIHQREFYIYTKIKFPRNYCISRPEIITSGYMLKELFPQKENLVLKLFAISELKKEIANCPKIINYQWVIFEKGNIIFSIPAFQNGPKISSSKEYQKTEVLFNDEFRYENRRFFLHTEKNDLCIREINK